MNNKWVIFDLDDVVYNFREQWYMSSLKDGIEIPHYDEWPSYDDLNYFKMRDQDQLRDMFIRHKCLENATPEPEAKEAIDFLKAHGFKVGALTARVWHPQAHEVTIDSFKRNGLAFDKLVVSGLHHDRKSVHIDKFGEIFGFVDDSIGHVKDFKSKNIPNVYLRERPWNASERQQHESVSNLLEFSGAIIHEYKNTFNSLKSSMKIRMS